MGKDTRRAGVASGKQKLRPRAKSNSDLTRNGTRVGRRARRSKGRGGGRPAAVGVNVRIAAMNVEVRPARGTGSDTHLFSLVRLRLPRQIGLCGVPFDSVVLSAFLRFAWRQQEKTEYLTEMLVQHAPVSFPLERTSASSSLISQSLVRNTTVILPVSLTGNHANKAGASSSRGTSSRERSGQLAAGIPTIPHALYENCGTDRRSPLFSLARHHKATCPARMKIKRHRRNRKIKQCVSRLVYVLAGVGDGDEKSAPRKIPMK